MFTVKYIDTKGAERLYECDNVEYLRTGNRFVDGIFLDPEEPEGVLPNAMQAGSTEIATPDMPERRFKHVIHFCDRPRLPDEFDPIVYVMNRFGSTVATYRL